MRKAVTTDPWAEARRKSARARGVSPVQRPTTAHVVDVGMGNSTPRRNIRKPFRSYGEDGPMYTVGGIDPQIQSDLADAMHQALAGLRDTLTQARAQVNATPSTTGNVASAGASALLPFLAPFLMGDAGAGLSDEERNSILNGLMSMENLINDRQADIAEVLVGGISPDRWYNSVKVIHDGILSMVSDLKNATFKGQLQQKLDDVTGSLKSAFDNISQVAQQLGTPIKWGLSGITFGVLALLAFVAYKYLTAPLRIAGVAEYRPRKRRKVKRF